MIRRLTLSEKDNMRENEENILHNIEKKLNKIKKETGEDIKIIQSVENTFYEEGIDVITNKKYEATKQKLNTDFHIHLIIYAVSISILALIPVFFDIQILEKINYIKWLFIVIIIWGIIIAIHKIIVRKKIQKIAEARANNKTKEKNKHIHRPKQTEENIIEYKFKEPYKKYVKETKLLIDTVSINIENYPIFNRFKGLILCGLTARPSILSKLLIVN